MECVALALGQPAVTVADVGTGEAVLPDRLVHVVGRDAGGQIDIDEENVLLAVSLFRAGQRGCELEADGAAGAGNGDDDGAAVLQVRTFRDFPSTSVSVRSGSRRPTPYSAAGTSFGPCRRGSADRRAAADLFLTPRQSPARQTNAAQNE